MGLEIIFPTHIFQYPEMVVEGLAETHLQNGDRFAKVSVFWDEIYNWWYPW